MGEFADALALSQHLDSERAVRLAGWQPCGRFPDDVEMFYRPWKPPLPTSELAP
jgi:hypothetical protein